MQCEFWSLSPPSAVNSPELLQTILLHLLFDSITRRRREFEMSNSELKMPKFNSEREEADWWFNNQDFALQVLQRAKAEGRLGHGSVKRRLAEKQAAISTTIRLDPTDLSLAKQQAERKGLRYQTYLKMLLHEALGREENNATR
jgi:predicted DNA binding CopG/RHH family protein